MINETRKAGIAEIRLSGGEPLLIANIRERCVAIRDAGLSYTITTNGSFLSKHLGWIEQVPPSTLWVSYHREYVSVDRFVDYARDACARYLKVGINLFEADVLALPDLIGQLVQVGVSRFKLINTTPIGRADTVDPKLVPDRNRLREITETQQRDSSHIVEIRAAFPLIDGLELGPRTCVLRTRSLLSIDFDGSVYPCCVTLGYADARIGDLSRESLETIVVRVTTAPSQMPCERLLHPVAVGNASCPLALVTMH